jgi:4,5-DOPA dioxygenase extradiol
MRMPVIFVGHGSPMTAITENKYKKEWIEIGKKLPKPKAIMCISAHWLSIGSTSVTMVENPKTIHDFAGFPDELYQQEYPAPGAPEYAMMTIGGVKSIDIQKDYEWGLDHGTWSVLMNMYPKADVPVFQLSIDYSKSTEYHFNLGRELSFLRDEWVLIIASGNIVHNLRKINWSENAEPYEWAIQFDNLVKKSIEDNDPKKMIDYQKSGALAELSHPSSDHFLPLLYAVGLRNEKDGFYFFNDSIDMGSLSMRSVVFSS